MAVERMLGLAAIALKSNFTRLALPYKLNFSVTYLCQSRCLTCNIWQIKPKNELRIDEINEIAEKNNYFKWIEITGGEVFLRNDIVDIARAFYKNSKHLYIMTMPTNSLCNPDMEISKIEEILEMGIPRFAITLSLDGYRELHDKIRGINGNYDKVINMYKRLLQLKTKYKNLYFVFGYTLSSMNQGKFFETFNAVKNDIPKIKYNDFHINLGQISSNYYRNDSMQIAPDSNSVSEEISKIVKSREGQFSAIQMIENTFLKNLSKYAATGVPPIKNRSIEASVFLDSYGNLYPSIMWDLKLGNVRENNYSITDILNSKAALDAKKIISDGGDPKHWTSCEAYQSIVGNIPSIFSR